MFNLGLLVCIFGLTLFILGRIARALSSKTAIKQLLDARATYEWCGTYKNWHYDRFLETSDPYEEDEARYWQARQVCEKARWSALLSAFMLRVK